MWEQATKIWLELKLTANCDVIQTVPWILSLACAAEPFLNEVLAVILKTFVLKPVINVCSFILTVITKEMWLLSKLVPDCFSFIPCVVLGIFLNHIFQLEVGLGMGSLVWESSKWNKGCNGIVPKNDHLCFHNIFFLGLNKSNGDSGKREPEGSEKTCSRCCGAVATDAPRNIGCQGQFLWIGKLRQQTFDHVAISGGSWSSTCLGKFMPRRMGVHPLVKPQIQVWFGGSLQNWSCPSFILWFLYKLMLRLYKSDLMDGPGVYFS